MPNLQIRNVPEAVHRVIKARAAMAGMSLSEYLLLELRNACERPSLDEIRERVRRRRPVKLPVSPARLIREERDER